MADFSYLGVMVCQLFATTKCIKYFPSYLRLRMPIFFPFQNLHFRPIVTEWKSFDANMARLTNAPFKRFFTLSSNEIQWRCLSRMLLYLDVNNKSFQHPTKAFELCTFQQFHSGFDWISSLFCWITNSILKLILSRHSSRLLTVFTKWSIL